MTFVSKIQSKDLMILDGYLPNFQSLIVFIALASQSHTLFLYVGANPYRD